MAHQPGQAIADARAREVTWRRPARASDPAIVPKLLDELIGTRFKVVSGYDHRSGLHHGGRARRGRRHLRAIVVDHEGVAAALDRRQPAQRHRADGVIDVRDLPDVPSALDLIEDPQSKQVMELILIRQEAGRPFAAPPERRPTSVAALRQAFADTLADPEFIAEAAKTQLEIEPMTGDEIAKMLAKAYAAPKGVVERAAELVYPGAPKAQ